MSTYKHYDIIRAGGMLGILMADDFGMEPYYFGRSTGPTGWNVEERWEDDIRTYRTVELLGNAKDTPELPLELLNKMDL